MKLTKRMNTPEPVSVPALASKPDYGELVVIDDVPWNRGGKPPHPGWWNAVGEEFARKNCEAARENFSHWDGKEWTMAIHISMWKPDHKQSHRNNQAHVVWREVQP